MDKSVLKLNESFDGIPVLTLEPDAHLACHGGYRFQVSTNMDGLSSVASSTTSLSEDLRICKRYDMSSGERKKFNQLMALSHVYQASMFHPEFWKEMQKDATLLNSLMEQTTRSCEPMLFSKDFDLHYLLSLIEEKEEVVLSQESLVFNVMNDKDDKSLGAKVVVEDNSLSLYNLETGKWFILNFNNILNFKLSDEDYQEALSRFIYVLGCKAQLGWHFNVTNFNGEVVEQPLEGEGKQVYAHRLSFELGRCKYSALVKKSSIFGN